MITTMSPAKRLNLRDAVCEKHYNKAVYIKPAFISQPYNWFIK